MVLNFSLSGPIRKYSQAEIARHDKAEDCWLIVDDKVYDVTNFLPKHPGGDIIMSHAGKILSHFFAVID